jgi:hypothetical protein
VRSLFNNPWFIAALGVFAMAYLGISVIKPLFSDNPQGAAVGSVEFEIFDEFEDQVAAAVSGRSTGLAANREDIAWLSDLSRDPFSGSLISQELGTVDVLPKVEALFVGAGVQAAVINNRLVRVGDMVDRYRVTDIAVEHVQVSLGDRSFRLEPDV